MRNDVRNGLSASPKSLPPVWFYDEVGSLLFDRITRLPEYYLTRAERSILENHALEIVRRAEPETLVELGSGTSEKTRLVLDAMAAHGSLRSITLLDISEEVLRQAAVTLSDRYEVPVHAVVGDFREDLPKLNRNGRQLWAFLGSTIGNFTPVERRSLLGDFRAAMADDDHLLLGTDLVKDETRLLAAYDDAEGVTAAFNLNVLAVLNGALHADFDLQGFEHVARWNAACRWIEMRLRARDPQTVRVRDLDMHVGFSPDEEMLTEISAKFEPSLVADELTWASLPPVQMWLDGHGDFMLTLARCGQ
jgi:L-histidine N-alpha-methyltransferase